MAIHVYIPSICEIEARGSGVQSQPQLYRKFKVGLGYKRLFQKQNRRTWKYSSEDLMTSVSSTAIGYLTSLGDLMPSALHRHTHIHTQFSFKKKAEQGAIDADQSIEFLHSMHKAQGLLTSTI